MEPVMVACTPKIPEHERVEVSAMPEEWLHLHGKALSGLRHSHPLKPGEDVSSPWHDHEGEWVDEWTGQPGRRAAGAALYFTDRMPGPIGEDQR